jgi:light-regulated signal transduction histidine kinase (bacteriophytochrome)
VAADLSERVQAEETLRKVNEELEDKVRARTSDLEVANEVPKKSEDALKDYSERLKRSNTELQQFAYIASHDLQEPLRMVISYLQLLDKRLAENLDEKSRLYMQVAIDGGFRMKRMIDDLLTYSRVEGQSRKMVPVNMNEVVIQSLVDLKVSVAENGASITSDPLPTIVADKHQMVHLLTNLIGNAIKYRDEAAPQVHVSAFKQDGRWIFSVQDNGIGIAPEHRVKIFNIFQRLHTQDEYSGTGIGLAIAKRIVNHQGGRIWVESEVGKGSTFSFSLQGEKQESVSNPIAR